MPRTGSPSAARPPSPGPHPLRRSAAAGLAVVAALALVLTGCGSREDSSQEAGNASDARAGGGEAATAPQAAAPDGEAGSEAAEPGSGAAKSTGSGTAATGSGTITTQVVRTAEIGVQVEDLAGAAARVRRVAEALGGQVAAETTGYAARASRTSDAPEDTGTAGTTVAVPGESVLVLRIPEPRLDEALTRVAGLPGGKTLTRTSSTRDVTGDIADLDSRVATQRASLARVRALMDRATSLQDVVTLEAELSRRQADLEALEARLAALRDQAEFATLSVELRTPSAAPAEAPRDTGFLAGLRIGWHALERSTVAVLTVLGALLPGAVVLGVVAGPGWILLRRRAARRGTDVTGTAPAPQGTAPRPVGTAPATGSPTTGGTDPGH